MELNFFKRKKTTPTVEERSDENSFLPLALLFGNNSNSVGNGMTISAVYRAVDFISSQFAMLDCNVIRRDENGFVKQAVEHPLYNLLSKEPNKNITRHTLMKTVITSMLLKGNAYIYINRDSRGTVTSLEYIASDDVTITMDGNSPVYNIPGSVLPTENLIHIKNFTYDGINGVSTLAFALNSLNIAKSADNQAANFFSNGCAVGGIISTEQKLNAQQKDEIRTAWRSAFEYGQNNGVAVLGSGMSYTPIEIDASTAQLLETRQYSVNEVARWFNISPILLYDLSKNSYNTAEASNLEFLSNTLMPIIDKIQLEFFKKIFKPSEKKVYDIKFDTEGFLKADLKTMASYYTQLFQIGAITTNEVRKKLNFKEVDGGDVVFLQSNLVPNDYYNNQNGEVKMDNNLKMDKTDDNS